METERLPATVSQVLWAAQDGQFAVILAKDEDGDSLKATGPLADLTPGQQVVLVGGWREHPKHGPTFAADLYELAMPSTPEGMVRFLASERFKGVGKARAKRIVDAFGDDLDTVLTNEPHRLHQEVTGISPALAESIGEAWAEAGVLPTIVERLAHVGASPTIARAIAATYHARGIEILDSNPYLLLDIPGMAWKCVDALGRLAGIAPEDPRRLAAGTYDYVLGRCMAHGHTVVAREEVQRALPATLGGDHAAEGIRAAIQAGLIDPVDAHHLSPGDLAKVEQRVAHQIMRFIQSPPVRTTEAIEIDPMLTPEQGDGVRAVLEGRLSVLTGGPGTGKTTTIKQVVAQAQAAGWTVAMCAPTGRAAKRMEELTHLEGIDLVQKFTYKLTQEETDRVDVAVIPAFTALRSIQTLIDSDRLPVALGAQDVAVEDAGAFTGAVSAPMLASLDVRWVLAGHSERREIFGDTDTVVNAKVHQILKHGMQPILCVGETLDQREAGETDAVLTHQVTEGLKGVSATDIARVVIAYEPVWAIGTGKTATPEDANAGNATVRATARDLYGDAVAEAIIIQYGGSVKPGNVAELMAQPDIDGALVGGASLDAEDFAALIAAS